VKNKEASSVVKEENNFGFEKPFMEDE